MHNYTKILLAEESPLSRLKIIYELREKFDLKKLCPLSSVEELNINDNVKILKKIRFLLLAMNILDEIFIEITGFERHIYILGDGTIFNFLDKNIFYEDIFSIDKSYYLEIICTLGLSYRFNVAKKFGYSDTKIMQLRLNGWGRAYCLDKENSEDYIKLKVDLYNYWMPILEKYKETYIELTNYCDSLERPLNVEQIHKINEYVPIKIVT